MKRPGQKVRKIASNGVSDCGPNPNTGTFSPKPFGLFAGDFHNSRQRLKAGKEQLPI
jgi:hypothetical protein